jgi:CRISPR-associated protein Cas1
LRIEQPNEKPRRAPINQLEQVIVYGNPLVETSVWRALSEAAIPTVMLSTRGTGAAAILSGGLAAQLNLRRMQHRIANDKQGQLTMATWFIDRKLQSYDLPLFLLAEKFGVHQEDCDDFCLQRNQTQAKLQQADSVAVIMGLEGSMAHAWFALLARHLPRQWNFSGRNRRPPRDPVNALLSLSYTLMHSELQPLLLSSGLDPALGFLHQQYPGREALILDFSELYRAAVDTFVLQLLASKQLDTDSFFYREVDGCRLNKQSRPVFFQAWADFRHHWPRATCSDLQEDRPTTPFNEQVRGHIAQLREFIQKQESSNE